MSKPDSTQKRGKNKNSVTALISAEELKKANERAAEILSNCGVDTGGEPSFDAVPVGMEFLSKELTTDHKRIMNGIFSDIFADPEEETRPAVYRKLYAAAKRMGYTGTKGDEVRFFKTLADPAFNEIVKVVGRGLIGFEVLEVIDKTIEQAKDGCKTSQKRVLEIAGFIDSKYDYYMKQYNMTHNGPLVEGDMNFGDKSDKELEDLIADVRDVTEEAEIIS